MSTELEQLLNATAVQPGRPVDLSLVTGRVARRRQTRMTATFAGALAAAMFAFSLVGDTLPTSAPVIGEVPGSLEVVDAAPAPAEQRQVAPAEADGGLDLGIASAESLGGDQQPAGQPRPDVSDGAERSGSTSPVSDPSARTDDGWYWTFDDGPQGWQWSGAMVRGGGVGLSSLGCGEDGARPALAWSHDASIGALVAGFSTYPQKVCADGEPRWGYDTATSEHLNLWGTATIVLDLHMDVSEVDWDRFRWLDVNWSDTVIRRLSPEEIRSRDGRLSVRLDWPEVRNDQRDLSRIALTIWFTAEPDEAATRNSRLVVDSIRLTEL